MYWFAAVVAGQIPHQARCATPGKYTAIGTWPGENENAEQKPKQYRPKHEIAEIQQWAGQFLSKWDRASFYSACEGFSTTRTGALHLLAVQLQHGKFRPTQRKMNSIKHTLYSFSTRCSNMVYRKESFSSKEIRH